MADLTRTFATDEDVAIRAQSDFGLICPTDQVLCNGTGASFEPSNRWRLIAPTMAFAAQGVCRGHVVHLLQPAELFGPTGAWLAVEAAGDGWLHLRQIGGILNAGMPPGPEQGASGVAFKIQTLDPQIDLVNRDLDRLFGINEASIGRSRGDLRSVSDLTDIAVLMLLVKQYRACASSDTSEDAFVAKALQCQQDLSDALARFTLDWRPGDGRPFDAITRFDTRISR